MAEDCRQYFMVEHNGDIYPCDFFNEPEWRLGNIMEDEWSALYHNKLYRDFGHRKRRWNSACDSCEWVKYCAGDCPKHRYLKSRQSNQLSYLCAAWKQFYSHTMPRFERLAAQISATGAVQ